LLWDSPDWRKDVFGKKSVSKYNVNSFFFQLIVKKILIYQCVGTEGVECALAWDETDKWV